MVNCIINTAQGIRNALLSILNLTKILLFSMPYTRHMKSYTGSVKAAIYYLFINSCALS